MAATAVGAAVRGARRPGGRGRRGRRRRFGVEMGAEAGQPVELVGELVVADGPAVRHVHRRHPHAAARGADQAGLRVGRDACGEAGDRVGEADAAGDRDAVPAALAVVHAGVAAGVEVEGGERVVGRLRLLQAEDVRLGRVDPIPQALEPLGRQRVDVPRGDAHARHATGTTPPDRHGGWVARRIVRRARGPTGRRPARLGRSISGAPASGPARWQGRAWAGRPNRPRWEWSPCGGSA